MHGTGRSGCCTTYYPSSPGSLLRGSPVPCWLSVLAQLQLVAVSTEGGLRDEPHVYTLAQYASLMRKDIPLSPTPHSLGRLRAVISIVGNTAGYYPRGVYNKLPSPYTRKESKIMSAKTLLSVRIPAPLSNRLQKNADDIGIPLSAYVRQLLADELHQQDILASVHSTVNAALTEHDARMTDTLGQLLDKYTGQGA